MAPILITGCSSAIGRATAVRLARAGRTVVATARQAESIAELERVGCRVLPLEVSVEESMVDALRAVESDLGPVWALVNNAEYGELGTIEETPIGAVHRQFETNVFGLARLCQLVLPRMRAAGRGRIVNVGAAIGTVGLATAGFHSASRNAVAAITEALRCEVRPFGIAVSLVEPGPVRAGSGCTAGRAPRSVAALAGRYGTVATALDDALARTFGRPLVRVSPDRVAAVIQRALSATTPRPRYPVRAAGPAS